MLLCFQCAAELCGDGRDAFGQLQRREIGCWETCSFGEIVDELEDEEFRERAAEV